MPQLLAAGFKKPAVLFEGMLLKKIVELIRVARIKQIQRVRPPKIKKSEKHRHCGMEQKARALLGGGQMRNNDYMHRLVVLRQTCEARYFGEFKRPSFILIK